MGDNWNILPAQMIVNILLFVPKPDLIRFITTTCKSVFSETLPRGGKIYRLAFTSPPGGGVPSASEYATCPFCSHLSHNSPTCTNCLAPLPSLSVNSFYSSVIASEDHWRLLLVPPDPGGGRRRSSRIAAIHPIIQFMTIMDSYYMGLEECLTGILGLLTSPHLTTAEFARIPQQVTALVVAFTDRFKPFSSTWFAGFPVHHRSLTYGQVSAETARMLKARCARSDTWAAPNDLLRMRSL